MINIDDVRRILEMAREHELSELEVESEGFRIRIRKDSGGAAHVMTMPAVQPLAAAPAAPAPAAPAPPAAPPPEREPDMELAGGTSPSVGTF
jgi:acetyl-CoA carboxylase biotin carboxyl carrier protein